MSIDLELDHLWCRLLNDFDESAIDELVNLLKNEEDRIEIVNCEFKQNCEWFLNDILINDDLEDMHKLIIKINNNLSRLYSLKNTLLDKLDN